MSHELDVKARVLNRQAVRGYEGRETHLLELGMGLTLIQALISIGPEAVNDLLQQEVCRLLGERFSREGEDPGYATNGTTVVPNEASRRRK